MKKNLCLGLSLLFFVWSCPLLAEPLVFYRPLRPIVRTINGLKVFFLPDPRLPLVRATLFIKGGSVLDPFGKEGLADLAMDAIRLGGSDKKPEEIEEWIESVGGQMDFDSTSEYMTASLGVLAKDQTQGLSLFFSLILRPKVDETQFKVLKKRTMDGLKRQREEPLRFTMKQFPSLVYGKPDSGLPGSGKQWWGRVPTEASLKAIRRDDVLNFHQNYFYPDRMVLAISGDFDVETLSQQIQTATDQWSSSTKELPKIPPIERHWEPSVHLINKPGLTQTTIIVGHYGEKRGNPDKYPLIVMNFILGGSGSLASRMGDEIRSREGKAYAVWTLFGFSKDDGVFQTISQTATANTAIVVSKIKEILQQMATDPKIQEDELNRAKESILRSFFFSYETRAALINDLAKFDLLGYPENYLDEFQKKIRAVTKADVERVAKQYLRPDALRILLFGDKKAVEKVYTGEKGLKIQELKR